MASQGDDCYFFYYSSCAKGGGCPFRHSREALGNEVTCKLWEVGRCVRQNCRFRHMKIEKSRGDIACYWETQPSGCQKPHCVFRHNLPRNQFGTIPQKQAQAPLAGVNNTSSEDGTSGQRSKTSSPVELESPRVQPVIFNPFDEESDQESPASSPVKKPVSTTSGPGDQKAVKPILKSASQDSLLKKVQIGSMSQADLKLGLKSLAEIQAEELRKIKESLEGAEMLLKTRSVVDSSGMEDTMAPAPATETKMESSSAQEEGADMEMESQPTEFGRRIVVSNDPSKTRDVLSRLGRQVDSPVPVPIESPMDYGTPDSISYQEDVYKPLGYTKVVLNSERESTPDTISNRLGSNKIVYGTDTDRNSGVKSRLGATKIVYNADRDRADSIKDRLGDNTRARPESVKSRLGGTKIVLKSDAPESGVDSARSIKSRLGFNKIRYDSDDAPVSSIKSRLGGSSVPARVTQSDSSISRSQSPPSSILGRLGGTKIVLNTDRERIGEKKPEESVAGQLGGTKIVYSRNNSDDYDSGDSHTMFELLPDDEADVDNTQVSNSVAQTESQEIQGDKGISSLEESQKQILKELDSLDKSDDGKKHKSRHKKSKDSKSRHKTKRSHREKHREKHEKSKKKGKKKERDTYKKDTGSEASEEEEASEPLVVVVTDRLGFKAESLQDRSYVKRPARSGEASAYVKSPARSDKASDEESEVVMKQMKEKLNSVWSRRTRHKDEEEMSPVKDEAEEAVPKKVSPKNETRRRGATRKRREPMAMIYQPPGARRAREQSPVMDRPAFSPKKSNPVPKKSSPVPKKASPVRETTEIPTRPARNKEEEKNKRWGVKTYSEIMQEKRLSRQLKTEKRSSPGHGEDDDAEADLPEDEPAAAPKSKIGISPIVFENNRSKSKISGFKKRPFAPVRFDSPPKEKKSRLSRFPISGNTDAVTEKEASVTSQNVSENPAKVAGQAEQVATGVTLSVSASTATNTANILPAKTQTSTRVSRDSLDEDLEAFLGGSDPIPPPAAAAPPVQDISTNNDSLLMELEDLLAD